MAKKVDLALLSKLQEEAKGQELQKGSSTTSDPNFPTFRTPVNEDILVYVPKTNLVVTENGEDMELLETYVHSYKKGNMFGKLRCINGLQGGAFSQLNYDGVCPACEAMKDAWALYNRKMEAEAAKLGIDPQNDPGDVLKSARRKVLDEMDLEGAEEYVTFPIVIIPTLSKMTPDPKLAEKDENGNYPNLEVVYVTWRKKRYENHILAALDTLMNNPGHPSGMFWLWKFTYNVDPSKANARDSAKNAKYVPITEGGVTEQLEPYRAVLEDAAKEFTNLKATEVIIANQFMYKEDMQKEVDGIMAKTRSLLELSDANSVMGGQPQVSANPLESFGGGVTQNLGVTGSQPQPQPQVQLQQPQQPVQPQPVQPQPQQPIQFS